MQGETKMNKKSDYDILLADLDDTNIGSIIRVYNDVNMLKKSIQSKIELLQDKLKRALKERKWDSYIDDESKISVSLTTQQKEKVNKKSLKMLLNDEQYNQVVSKVSFEKLVIINKKDRERLKQYGKK